MLLATLALLYAVTDCGTAIDSESGQRQYDCIARALAARRPFIARLDKIATYEGDETGTVTIVARDPDGKVRRAVIFGPAIRTPLRVGGVVRPPELEREVRKRAGNPHDISGIVIVETTIDREGRVTGTRILKALPYGLDQAAEEIVKTLRFKPGRFFEQPVPVIWNVTARISGGEVIIAATPPQKRRVTSR